jgi:phage terminase large subunit-like protein
LDLSARIDLTAFVMIALWEGRWHVKPIFWTPEKGLHERSARDRQPYDMWVKQGLLRATPGASVDYAVVATDIAEIVEGLDIRGIAYDRWRIDVMKKAVEEANLDLPLVMWGQGFKDMSPAVDALECELLNDRISHGNHPILTMCASHAVVCKDEAGNRKITKLKSTGRVDGIVALTMAIGLAIRENEGEGISAWLSNPIIVRK